MLGSMPGKKLAKYEKVRKPAKYEKVLKQNVEMANAEDVESEEEISEEALEEGYLRNKKAKRRWMYLTFIALAVVAAIAFGLGVLRGEGNPQAVENPESPSYSSGTESEAFKTLQAEDGSRKDIIKSTIDSHTLRFKNLKEEDGFFDLGKGWCLNFNQMRIYENVRWQDMEEDLDGDGKPDGTSLCKSSCAMDVLCIGYMVNQNTCAMISTKDEDAASGIYLADGSRDYQCFAKQKDLHNKFTFRFGEVGEDECPRGFTFISNEIQCHEAADYFQTRNEFDDQQLYSKKKGVDKMIGCFRDSNSETIHFNAENLDGNEVQSHEDQLVCILKESMFEEKKSKKGVSGRAGPTNENVLCTDRRKLNGGIQGSDAMCKDATGDGRIMVSDCDRTCIQVRCEDDDTCAGWEEHTDFLRPVNAIEWVYGAADWITILKKTDSLVSQCLEPQGNANFRYLAQGDRLEYKSCRDAVDEEEDDICEMSYLQFFQSIFPEITEGTWRNLIAPQIEPHVKIARDCSCSCGSGDGYAMRPTKPPVPTYAPSRASGYSEPDEDDEESSNKPQAAAESSSSSSQGDGSCQVGMGAKHGAFEKSGKNSESACRAACKSNSLCVAFDFSSNQSDDACRLYDSVSSRYARIGEGGRQYCSMGRFKAESKSQYDTSNTGLAQLGEDIVMDVPLIGRNGVDGYVERNYRIWMIGGTGRGEEEPEEEEPDVEHDDAYNWRHYGTPFPDAGKPKRRDLSKQKALSYDERLEILKQQTEALQKVLLDYYTFDPPKPINASQIMEHGFQFGPDDAGAPYYEDWMDIYTDRFLRAILYDRKFVVATIGSSVAAGHDNCADDSYEAQVNHMMQPVFEPAGFEFEHRNGGMKGDCGDNYKNQGLCFLHTLGTDIDHIQYSWNYFEHGNPMGYRERIMRWAAKLPKVAVMTVIKPGHCKRPGSHLDFLKTYVPTLGYNEVCIIGGAHDAAGYVKKKHTVGDNLHWTTRYGEDLDAERKKSLGVVFRNWHPGPLGFQGGADTLAWAYSKAILRAIELIKSVNNPKEKWSEYPPRPAILDTPPVEECQPKGACETEIMPRCYNGEKPTFGVPGMEWIDVDHPEYPDYLDKSVYKWQRFYAAVTSLIPQHEKKMEKCWHIDRCAGWRHRERPKILDNQTGWLVFKIPKLEIGYVVVCLTGDRVKSLPAWAFKMNGIDVPLPEDGSWHFEEGKCIMVWKKFPNKEERKREFHFLAINQLPGYPAARPDHIIAI